MTPFMQTGLDRKKKLVLLNQLQKETNYESRLFLNIHRITHQSRFFASLWISLPVWVLGEWVWMLASDILCLVNYTTSWFVLLLFLFLILAVAINI